VDVVTKIDIVDVVTKIYIVDVVTKIDIVDVVTKIYIVDVVTKIDIEFTNYTPTKCTIRVFSLYYWPLQGHLFPPEDGLVKADI
jgi:hypothetical protein